MTPCRGRILWDGDRQRPGGRINPCPCDVGVSFRHVRMILWGWERRSGAGRRLQKQRRWVKSYIKISNRV